MAKRVTSFILLGLLILTGCSHIPTSKQDRAFTESEKIEFKLIKAQVERILKHAESNSSFKMTPESLRTSFAIVDLGEK
jgi:hypothetical protein